MLLLSRIAPLATGEVVVEVPGEVKAQAHEVLFGLIVEDERRILLALALVPFPVHNLALLGAVASDDAFAAALFQVGGVGAPFVVAVARRCGRADTAVWLFFRIKLGTGVEAGGIESSVHERVDGKIGHCHHGGLEGSGGQTSPRPRARVVADSLGLIPFRPDRDGL